MDLDSRQEPLKTITLRGKGNYLIAVFAAWALTGFFIWLDPLALYSRWSDGGNGFTSTNLVYLLIQMACAAIFQAYTYPRVELSRHGVLIRNVMTDTFIAWPFVEELNSEGKYLAIKAQGRWHSVTASEKMNVTVFLGRRGTADSMAATVERYRRAYRPPSTPPAPPPNVSPWRGVQRSDLALGACWLVYIVGAGLRSVST